MFWPIFGPKTWVGFFVCSFSGGVCYFGITWPTSFPLILVSIRQRVLGESWEKKRPQGRVVLVFHIGGPRLPMPAPNRLVALGGRGGAISSESRLVGKPFFVF